MWVCVFFFKQKTAYEMRISDWSSDVCSSDRVARLGFVRRARELGFTLEEVRALLGLAVIGEGSCAAVREVAASHLREVRERIADLKWMERVLADSVRACAAGLESGCPLLDALGAELRVAGAPS